MVNICDLVQSIISQYSVAAVFIEDIQLRKNVDSFKKLAQLQGALVSMFERNEYLYDFIPPAKWQGYCNARARTAKEIKEKISAAPDGKKQSKVLSIQFARSQFGIETDNDNLADAICIGYYVTTNINIQPVGQDD
jgi:Holliday junction resolvasome RuvABC endonuclease subunit